MKFSFAGPQIKKEVTAIDLILKDKKKPVTCIIGGSKVSKKINIIFNLIKNVNNIIIVGAMANNFLLYRGINIGKSLIEKNSEKLIKEIFFATKLKYIINRFGVIAGPWQFGKQDQGFVPLWVARHLFKKKLSYIGFGGYGHQVRDVIHIDDACNIIYQQIKKFKRINNTTFDIGGGQNNSISLKELTAKCEKLTKNKIKIRRISKTSIFDIPYYVTNNSKVKKNYSWEPTKSVDQILKDINAWLIKNKILRNYF